EVGAQHVAPLVVGHAQEQPVPRHAGVVDQDLDGPPGRLDLLHRSVDGRRVGDVGGHGQRLAAEVADGGGGFGRPLLVGPVAQPDPVAGGGQRQGAGPADAPGAAGDEHHAAGPAGGARIRAHAHPAGRPQRSTALDQVMPAPNPQDSTMSPAASRPSSAASARAIGIEAADVLPKRPMLTMHRSAGIFSRLAAAVTIRALAWWGRNQSTSSAVRPARARAAFEDSTTTRTARRKTSGPSIFIQWSPAATVAAGVGWRLPPGVISIRWAAEPSAPMSQASRPGPPAPPIDGAMTAAPAPSPKRMTVPRSNGSTTRVRFSAPMRRMGASVPAATRPAATTSP